MKCLRTALSCLLLCAAFLNSCVPAAPARTSADTAADAPSPQKTSAETPPETTAEPPQTEETAALPPPVIQTQPPDDTALLYAYEQAIAARSQWIAPALDHEDSVLHGGFPYYRVRGVESYSAFRETLLASFSPEITETLLQENMYIDHDGMLYAGDFSGPADLMHGGELYRIRTDSDSRRTLIVAEIRMTGGEVHVCEWFDCLHLHEYVYEFMEDRWVFTSFPLLDPLRYYEKPEEEKELDPSITFRQPELRTETPSDEDVVAAFREMHELFCFYAGLSAFTDRVLADEGVFRPADGVLMPPGIRFMLFLVCHEEPAREYMAEHFGEMPPALPDGAQFTVLHESGTRRLLRITAGEVTWDFPYEYTGDRWVFTAILPLFP